MKKKKITQWDKNRNEVERLRRKAIAEVDRLNAEGFKVTDSYLDKLTSTKKRYSKKDVKAMSEIANLRNIRRRAKKTITREDTAGLLTKSGEPLTYSVTIDADITKNRSELRQVANEMSKRAFKAGKRSATITNGYGSAWARAVISNIEMIEAVTGKQVFPADVKTLKQKKEWIKSNPIPPELIEEAYAPMDAIYPGNAMDSMFAMLQTNMPYATEEQVEAFRRRSEQLADQAFKDNHGDIPEYVSVMLLEFFKNSPWWHEMRKTKWIEINSEEVVQVLASHLSTLDENNLNRLNWQDLDTVMKSTPSGGDVIDQMELYFEYLIKS